MMPAEVIILMAFVAAGATGALGGFAIGLAHGFTLGWAAACRVKRAVMDAVGGL